MGTLIVQGSPFEAMCALQVPVFIYFFKTLCVYYLIFPQFYLDCMFICNETDGNSSEDEILLSHNFTPTLAYLK